MHEFQVKAHGNSGSQFGVWAPEQERFSQPVLPSLKTTSNLHCVHTYGGISVKSLAQFLRVITQLYSFYIKEDAVMTVRLVPPATISKASLQSALARHR